MAKEGWLEEVARRGRAQSYEIRAGRNGKQFAENSRVG